MDARDPEPEPRERLGLPDDIAELAPQFADAPGGTLMGKIGLEFLSVEPDRVVARIPVEGNTQPYGLLHGGATAALLETIGSFGSALAAGPDRLVMGIELNVNHIRGVRGGPRHGHRGPPPRGPDHRGVGHAGTRRRGPAGGGRSPDPGHP